MGRSHFSVTPRGWATRPWVTQALFRNTGGTNKTAVGEGTLYFNNADGNTALGYNALGSNTTGDSNTAAGYSALPISTTGSRNTAIGSSVLSHNDTGSDNTAVGNRALFSNTGNGNTAIGSSMSSNTAGSNNTAVGFQALDTNTTGFENTALGYQALLNSTGAGNTAVGYLAGQNLTTGDDNIDIGSDGAGSDSGVIRIGRSFINATYIAGIANATVSGSPVYVDSGGHLGLQVSSARSKDAIAPMGNASEPLFSLRPVTFRYKKNIDPKGAPQFGLVAEEVEKVNPDLVVRDAQGKVFTVRYEAVNAMLLNEFLKEHRKVQDLEATVAQQRKDFQAAAAHQQEQIEALTAGLQRVSAQVEMSRPARQMVLNNQ
jgi:endosialidase-like protein